MMNRLVTLTILFLGFPLGSLADSSQWGFITDLDLRAYCQATSGEGESQFGFIHDDDLRSLCRAEASNRQSECVVLYVMTISVLYAEPRRMTKRKRRDAS